MHLGRGARPEALTTEQQRLWNVLGGRCVRIGTEDSDCDVLDVEGAYANWLDDIGADFVILRPDFHVAATTADPVRLRSHLETILNELHLTADGRATATAE